MGRARIDDDCILLIVPAEGAGIEVGTSHCAELAIYHDNLGMVEAWRVHPYLAACLHQLMGVVETAVGCQWDITLCTQHDLHLHASFHGILQSLLQLMTQGEVGTDELDAVLCVVDGVDIEVADDVLRDMWLTVDDAHNLVLGGSFGGWLQVLNVLVLAYGRVVLCTMDVLSAHLVPLLGEDFL